MQKLTIPHLFSDGMVLQAERETMIWGRAPAGVEVLVRFCGADCRGAADDAGKWQLRLPPVSAGGPFCMTITAADEAITLVDVYAGEVWLCSGQSNMELPMARLKDRFPGEFIPPVNHLIRQCKVTNAYNFAAEQEEFAELSYDGVPAGGWVAATPETLLEFSGTAWFFAQRRFEKHHIPIGLIHAAIGGTPAEAWMSKDALRSFPALLAESGQYAEDQFRMTAVKQNDEYMQAWETANNEADCGLAEDWAHSADGADWNEITLPNDFAVLPELAGFCGTLWLTRSFVVPAAFAGCAARLWLGTIVDADTAFVNGAEIGSTGYRYPPRKYEIPEGMLAAGKNRITLRVVCNNGLGGITRDKPFKIFLGPDAGADTIELGGVWRCKIGGKQTERRNGFFIQWQPGGLFNAMIAPLLRYVLQGVIWYQGESNDKDPAAYETLFPALIRDWRMRFAQPEVPFLFVQLPLWGNPAVYNEESAWAIIREAQYKTLALAKTGMACALDLGEWNDLHPLDKKGVGYRLALAAASVIDGAANTAPGAVLHELRRHDKQLICVFRNVGAGLYATGSIIVTVIDDEGATHHLFAKIAGETAISAGISGIKNPRKIYYAWANNPLGCNLYNGDGLPALPFQCML